MRGVNFLIARKLLWKAGVGMRGGLGKQTSGSICHWLHSLFVSGRAHRGRWGILIWKVLRKVALWSVTLNLLSQDVLSGGGRKLSPSPLPIPLHTTLILWNLHVLFMPSIFRIIPNLIAVGLLLPAAAPKIKSRPREGMLGWSFFDRPNVVLLKELRSPSTTRSRKTTPDMQMLNIKYDYIDWAPETSFIYIFEHFPRADWLEWKHSVNVCVAARLNSRTYIFSETALFYFHTQSG